LATDAALWRLGPGTELAGVELAAVELEAAKGSERQASAMAQPRGAVARVNACGRAGADAISLINCL
jgi:hypothetical protein